MAATSERRPADRRDDGFLVDALVGAVVSVVLSFTLFSPLLGGAVAGYLHGGDERDGLKVGAVSGAIAAIPVLALLVLAFGVLSVVAIVPEGTGPGLPFAFAGLLTVVAGFVLLFVVALSAVGGAVGAAVARERARPRAAPGPPVRTTPEEREREREREAVDGDDRPGTGRVERSDEDR